MNIIEKFQTLLILAAVIAGLVLGQAAVLAAYAEVLVVPFLLVMLYGLFLAIPLKDLRQAFTHRTFLGVSLGINFVWTPLLAWGLGALFLDGHPALWLGFIMLMVTPCTDWYLVFTSIAKGNLSLSTSILPLNMILQFLLLPLYLFLFAGTIETVALATIIESVLLVLLLPFLLAQGTKYIWRKRPDVLEQKLLPFFSHAQIIFLSLAVAAMFAAQGAALLNNLSVITVLVLPVLLFFVINVTVAQTAGRLFRFSYADTVSLTLTTVARNSPVALAIAVTAFPGQPLAALALVIGPLIELLVLAMVAQLLLSSRKRLLN
ncbi:arsenic resistance protein [Marinococcus halophilus]|uniref:arsenic resistance protein n=1 Tax=Marinococcus halophilus TaxID=1371 RepID=UPI0009A751EF|nr:bile acid:sodium symporter [Marinococcus halophilus]